MNEFVFHLMDSSSWRVIAIAFAVVHVLSVQAAPEASNREELTPPEASTVDPALAQAGVNSLVRAKVKSSTRTQNFRLRCSSTPVLCIEAEGSLIVMPGAVIGGDLINAPGVQAPCSSQESRCKNRKP